MLLSEPDELIRDVTERIQLKRMFVRAGFEKLIETLLEIDRRRARHVIEVITLAIPRERRPHRRAITRMKKVVRAGKVLLLRKRGGAITKIRRVIIKEFATVLPRRAARERDAHRRHRLHRRCFHSNHADTPLSQCMREGSAGS